MLNRTALIVRPAQPFIEWARDIDDSILPDPDGEQHIYLVSEFDDERQFEKMLKLVYSEIFERELESWFIEEELWPKDRTFAMFLQWFKIEYHTIIEDLCDYPLQDDEPFELADDI